MSKSATDVMHDILYAAVIDAVMALKAGAGGLPNNLLRDLNAIHANTTFADLPKDVQAAITSGVRAAFTRLLREGYSVSSGSAPLGREPSREHAPRRDPAGRSPGGRPGAPRPPRSGPGGREPGPRGPAGPRPPRGGKPKPR